MALVPAQAGFRGSRRPGCVPAGGDHGPSCPYDALYIDPDSQTAAKCNFCSHRLEQGLQPSCVVVCPEQAIVAPAHAPCAL
jgi:hypothetical protein